MSTVRYIGPAAPGPAFNVIDIEKPREEVWKAAIPKVARQFFVINNIEVSSGLVNLSFSSDPMKYVDCGLIGVALLNGNEYQFPAASAQANFPFFTPAALLQVERKVYLEGRINLVFEALDANKTRISANTRYVITRDMYAYYPNGARAHYSRAEISFNTGEVGRFPGQSMTPETMHCYPTGVLELNLLKSLQ